MDEDRMWNSVAAGSAIAGVALTKPLVERGWRLAFRSDPPGNPADPDVAWRDALIWAMVTGAVVGLIRLFAQRLAAAAWHRAKGSYPNSLSDTHP